MEYPKTVYAEDIATPREGKEADMSMKNDVQRRAVDMISEHMEVDGHVEFPIDPFALAKKLGIQVEFREGLPDDVSGLLIQEDENSPVIAVINSTHHPNRRRFTMAHELGHFSYYQNFLAHEKKIGLVERRQELSGAGTDPYEVDANSFAAELLMPESVVRVWGYRGKSRVEMAKGFGVSLDAIGHRLNKLGLSYLV